MRIDSIYKDYLEQFRSLFGPKESYGLTQENVQARIRGALLMAVSNAEDRIVLATGNKSELSMGYTTLYGDLVGGLAVLGDVLKRDVYALARHANRDGERIPRGSIEKPPSAELAPGQKDSDSLPPYPVLDEVLHQAIELGLPADEIEPPAGATPRDGRVDPDARSTATSTSAARRPSCCASRRRPTARAGAFPSSIAAAGASEPDWRGARSPPALLGPSPCVAARALRVPRRATRAACRSGDTRRRRCASSRSREDVTARWIDARRAAGDPARGRGRSARPGTVNDARARRLRGDRPARRPTSTSTDELVDADGARGRGHLQPARAHALRRGRPRERPATRPRCCRRSSCTSSCTRCSTSTSPSRCSG